MTRHLQVVQIDEATIVKAQNLYTQQRFDGLSKHRQKVPSWPGVLYRLLLYFLGAKSSMYRALAALKQAAPEHIGKIREKSEGGVDIWEVEFKKGLITKLQIRRRLVGAHVTGSALLDVAISALDALGGEYDSFEAASHIQMSGTLILQISKQNGSIAVVEVDGAGNGKALLNDPAFQEEMLLMPMITHTTKSGGNGTLVAGQANLGVFEGIWQIAALINHANRLSYLVHQISLEKGSRGSKS